MQLLPASILPVRSFFRAKHGTPLEKVRLMGNMRRNLRAVTSASGFLEQLFIVTRLLNLERV
jgi:hypothetical protein